MMKSMICRRKVLVLLDDVDKLGQLEALAGKHNWFGSGSRIVITTRDEHLLRTHKVDLVYPIRLLSNDEAIQLFKKHAYNEEDPVEDYEALSSRVISYVSGLPLALRVLGSFLFDKSKKEWISALDKLKDIPDLEIMDILKISFDGLEAYQKELFLDIACFWRFRSLKNATEVFEACGYHPEIGIKVLRQKALINIVYKDLIGDAFDMHDLVEEMGRYVVRGKHPNNPRIHSRVWISEEIEEMCFGDATMENDQTKALTYHVTRSDGNDLSLRFCEIVSNMKKLRWLMVTTSFDGEPTFLSNELQFIDWAGYLASPFPESFQPIKLVVLKLRNSKQKELWRGCKRLPCLRALELTNMKELLSTPDFGGLPCLQKLTLVDCEKLKEIQPSLGSLTSLEYLNASFCYNLKRFPTMSQMKNIKTLRISSLKDGEIPCGIGVLSNLQELNLSHNSISRLDFSLSELTKLKCFDVSYCLNLLKLPKLPSRLAILKANGCGSLTMVEDFNNDCTELCQVELPKYGWSCNKLLQSMLNGNAVKNRCTCLYLYKSLEIPKEFTPPLVRGSRFRLELPENWSNRFSGFLICAEFWFPFSLLKISMLHLSGMDFKDDMVWEERDGDGFMYKNGTLMWYVSFGSLRDTTWWNQTYKFIEFNILKFVFNNNFISLGVRLVDKKNTTGGLTETSIISSSPYTPKIIITDDSSSELKLDLCPYGNKI